MKSQRYLLIIAGLLALLALAACGTSVPQQAPADHATPQTPPATHTASAPQPADHATDHQPPATGHQSPATASPQPADHTTGHQPPATGHQSPATGQRPPAIQVDASEFAFSLSQTTFAANTPYRFVIENRGAIAHELVVLEPGAEHAHDDHGNGNAVSADELTAGATVSRELRFAAPGQFEIACKLPGHYEAGMKITITVE